MRKIIVLVLAPILVLVTGCGKQDKEILANIGRKITSKFESAASPTRKKLEMGIQAMRGEILESSIEDSVLFRIRTDKNLKDQKIEVSSKEVGVILLKGTVPDEQSKLRAIEVAESTRGVNKVESELVEKISEDVAPKKAIDPKDAPEVKKEVNDAEKVPEKPKDQFQPFDPNQPKEKGEQDKPAPPLK